MESKQPPHPQGLRVTFPPLKASPQPRPSILGVALLQPHRERHPGQGYPQARGWSWSDPAPSPVPSRGCRDPIPALALSPECMGTSDTLAPPLGQDGWPCLLVSVVILNRGKEGLCKYGGSRLWCSSFKAGSPQKPQSALLRAPPGRWRGAWLPTACRRHGCSNFLGKACSSSAHR